MHDHSTAYAESPTAPAAAAAPGVTIPKQRRPADRPAGPRDALRSVEITVFGLIERHAATALRVSLASVYLWFGLLKLLGKSPVAALVSSTVPFGDPSTVVHLLGGVEIVLGIALLLGRAQRLVLLAIVGHLAGTFLTVVMAPAMLLQHHNPLLLTADGEFVLKNLVLITGALLLVASISQTNVRRNVS